MIKAALFHKIYGLFAAMLGIFLIAAVLPKNTAEIYFTLTSAIQLSIPFVGFGLTQSLVGNSTSNKAIYFSHKDIFLLLCFFLTFILIVLLIGEDHYRNGPSILLYAVLLLFLTSGAELIRTTFSDQTGFIVINTVIISLSIWIFFEKNFTYLMAFIPLAALIFVVFYIKTKNYKFIINKKNVTLTDFSHLLRAVRVSVFNQFYNIVIVSMALFGNLTESLTLILIYRLNVLLNWQVFYWLRFAHKKTSVGITSDTFKENKKITLINITSIGLFCLSLTVGYYFKLFEYFEVKFITKDFIEAALLFSAFKVLLSVTFPYELFTVYNKNNSISNRVFIFILVSIIAVSLLTYYVSNIFIILILIETILIASRIFSWKTL